MATINKGILILSPFFHPNIGGVETHLTDLVTGLSTIGYNVFVLTYSPITTPNTSWKPVENHPHLYIRRFSWLGKNLFHNLEKYPLLEFLYLTPYLFIRTFFWMITNHQKISVIHSHGINAALIGNIISSIFHKKHINSTHAIYDFKPNSQIVRIIRLIYNNCHKVLAQSKFSKKQLISYGVRTDKIDLYRYWVDLNYFKPQIKSSNKNNILFVGRLITKKGIRLIHQSAKKLPNLKFTVVGTGPESKFLLAHPLNNLVFIGKIDNHQIINYYHQATIFCSPVLYAEGFSRTLMEATACGLPVISSNLGTIPEILTPQTSILIKPTITNLTRTIKKLFNSPELLHTLRLNCRPYSQKYFGPKNITQITSHY